VINRPIEQAQLELCQQAINDAEWVSSDSRLAELCSAWRLCERVAVDTEFQRTDTFYPIPGLIQVGCNNRAYLIDPQAITDFGPFVGLLEDTSVLKLVHAASEDLELFAHCYDATPSPLFDTQTACAFLGQGLSIGYQRLLGTLFELEVDKQETRSDWLQRPLTDSQRRYAAADVVYLEAVYQRLATRLEAEAKLDWLLLECQQAADAALEAPDMDSYYLRFKQAWKLKPQQLSVLQVLSSWREREARARNMPRNFVIHNNTLQSIAETLPKTMGALSGVEQIRGRALSADGAQLLALVQQGLERARSDAIEALPLPLPRSCNALLKRLKEQVQQCADRLQIAPELLARRKDLEALVRTQLEQGGAILPHGLQGWREAVIGRTLVAELAGEKEELV
jgi:ribonuclease D